MSGSGESKVEIENGCAETSPLMHIHPTLLGGYKGRQTLLGRYGKAVSRGEA